MSTSGGKKGCRVECRLPVAQDAECFSSLSPTIRGCIYLGIKMLISWFLMGEHILCVVFLVFCVSLPHRAVFVDGFQRFAVRVVYVCLSPFTISIAAWTFRFVYFAVANACLFWRAQVLCRSVLHVFSVF